jgi:hypothetical protein
MAEGDNRVCGAAALDGNGGDLSFWIQDRQLCQATPGGIQVACTVACSLRKAEWGRCPIGRYAFLFEVRDAAGNQATATLEVWIIY